MMKILFFDIKNEQKASIKECLPDSKCIFFDFPLTPSSIPAEHRDAEVISVFVCSYINKEVIEAYPNLKLIVTRSVGYDHIDIKAAQQKNITVCNVPMYASISVAEHTFALMLALARNLISCVNQVKQHEIFSFEGINAFELNGKTLGIIGYGNIGKKVAHLARSFGMKILIHDDYAKEKTEEFVDLTQLLSNSDIITLHVPLTKETHHMINKKALKAIKPGAYIINTSRGALIETGSLVQALADRHIAGAALDVLEHEGDLACPLPCLLSPKTDNDTLKLFGLNQWLINQPNVIITAHCAFASKEALARLLKSTIECIKAWQAGNPLYCINK